MCTILGMYNTPMVKSKKGSFSQPNATNNQENNLPWRTLRPPPKCSHGRMSVGPGCRLLVHRISNSYWFKDKLSKSFLNGKHKFLDVFGVYYRYIAFRIPFVQWWLGCFNPLGQRTPTKRNSSTRSERLSNAYLLSEHQHNLSISWTCAKLEFSCGKNREWQVNQHP